jgi:hypothetical protein
MVGDDGPTLRGDFDDIADRVGEVDQEGLGNAGWFAGADTEGDGDAGGLGFADGAGFEEVENGMKGMAAREVVVSDLVFAEEPVAEGGGAEGDAMVG